MTNYISIITGWLFSVTVTNWTPVTVGTNYLEVGEIHKSFRITCADNNSDEFLRSFEYKTLPTGLFAVRRNTNVIVWHSIDYSGMTNITTTNWLRLYTNYQGVIMLDAVDRGNYTR